MSLRRTLASLIPFTVPAVMFGACAEQEVSLGLVMRAPAGVLDGATAVDLLVIDGDKASCDPTLGQVTGPTSGDGVVTFPMDQEGCGGGALWCKDITLDQDGNSKVFYVLATAGGAPLAQGCTTAAVDRDPLDISIKMSRFLPPRCCGNGVIEPSEQCDTGALAPTDCSGNGPAPGAEGCVGIFPDPVCECDCLAKEILLSSPNVTPTQNNDPGTKFELAMAFAGGSGNLGGGLRAVFTDTSTSNASTPDINIRYLNSELYPFGDTILDKQLRLAECTAVLKEGGTARTQKQPDVAQISSNIAGVVYASDQTEVLKFDVYVSGQSASGCADSPPLKVNAARLSSAEAPSIAAGPAGSGLIVWADGSELRGRIWTDSGTLTPANNDISIGTLVAGSRPRVAGGAGGWVVAYRGTGDDIYYRTVSTAASVGAEVRVNLATDGVQSQPDVAMLPDNRFALVWNNAGHIQFQRYNAQGAALQGDQDQAASLNSPEGMAPAIAGSTDVGGFYALAWAVPEGGVWSRFLGANSGFLFNSVTGQNDDYLASHPAVIGLRGSPAVAIGGAHVALGWQDDSVEHPGMYVRRFPLPQP